MTLGLHFFGLKKNIECDVFQHLEYTRNHPNKTNCEGIKKQYIYLAINYRPIDPSSGLSVEGVMTSSFIAANMVCL